MVYVLEDINLEKSLQVSKNKEVTQNQTSRPDHGQLLTLAQVDALSKALGVLYTGVSQAESSMKSHVSKEAEVFKDIEVKTSSPVNLTNQMTYLQLQRKAQIIDLQLQKLYGLNPSSKSYISQRSHILANIRKNSSEIKANLENTNLPLSFKEKLENTIQAVEIAMPHPTETPYAQVRNVDLDISNPISNELGSFNPDPKGPDYHSKSYWKNWLEKMFSWAFEGNWNGNNLNAFLKQLMNGMLHYNDLPKDLRKEFDKMMGVIFKRLYQLGPNDEGANVIIDLAVMLAGQLKENDGLSSSAAEKKALQMIGNFLNGLANGPLKNSSVSGLDGWLEDIASPGWYYWSNGDFLKQVEVWPSNEGTIQSSLNALAGQFLTPGLKDALLPSMQGFFWGCIKNENVWEKVADIIGGWDYMLFNSIMDVQDLVLKEIQAIRNLLNEMQDDISTMSNNKYTTQQAQNAAKDFLSNMGKLKTLASSRWLGKSSSGSGTALNNFVNFLLNWGYHGSALKNFYNPPSHLLDVASEFWYAFNNKSTSPISAVQQMTTNFSNILGTFSTASETQSMSLQNSETQLDSDLKINNSCRQTMTSLIHVITNYSNG